MGDGEIILEALAGSAPRDRLQKPVRPRAEIPKAPTEKRLAVDLASLRQCLDWASVQSQ